MPARSTFVHFAAKAAMLFGALFVVSVLLAAIPSHHAPVIQSQGSQQSGSQSQESQGMDHSSMPGMDMDDAKTNEAHAVHDMTRGHHDAHSLHMRMTAVRPSSAQDTARANEVVAHPRRPENTRTTTSRGNEGYKIFLPNLLSPNPLNYATSLASRSMLLAPLPCSTRKLPTAMNSSAPCTPCPSAPAKSSSTPAFR